MLILQAINGKGYILNYLVLNEESAQKFKDTNKNYVILNAEELNSHADLKRKGE
jgi:hypothetical protein